MASSLSGLRKSTADEPLRAGKGDGLGNIVFGLSITRNTSGSLRQPGAAEAFQVVHPVGFVLERDLRCEPVQGNIGLRAAQLR